MTTLNDQARAREIANDTLNGLGASVWSRDGNVAYRMGRAIKTGRVWTKATALMAWLMALPADNTYLTNSISLP